MAQLSVNLMDKSYTVTSLWGPRQHACHPESRDEEGTLLGDVSILSLLPSQSEQPPMSTLGEDFHLMRLAVTYQF